MQDEKVSNAVLLTALPFLGYCLIFAFEAGRCKYFSIPAQLISLNLTVAISGAIAIATVVAALPALFTDVLALNVNDVVFVRVRSSMFASGVALVFIGIGCSPEIYFVCLVLTIMYLGYSVGAIGKETPEERSAKAAAHPHIGTRLAILSDLAGRTRFIYGFILVNIGLLAYNVGFLTAPLRSSYPTIGGYAIVAIYGDSFIGVPIVRYRERSWSPRDAAVPTFGEGFAIFRSSDKGPLKFTSEFLGGLHSESYMRFQKGAAWDAYRTLLKDS